MIHVNCPSCQAPYEHDERRIPPAGLNMRCPKCGATFHVDRQGSVAKTRRPRPKKETEVGVGAFGKKSGMPPPPVSSAASSPSSSPQGTFGASSRPIAPAIDPDVTDLPAPAGARKPIAPAFEPASEIADDLGLELDLPAPAGSSADDGFDLDLPMPVDSGFSSGGHAALDDALELDLPAPVGAHVGDGLDLDLPAPAPSRGPLVTPFDSEPSIDLPAPVQQGAHEDLDLELDLPAPRGQAAPAADMNLDDLDLPMPKARGPVADAFGEIDLPAPASTFSQDEVDLPRVSGHSSVPAPVGVTDLPVAKGLDLPAPKGEADFGELDLSLPEPNADLPIASGESDLPQPKHRPSSRPLSRPPSSVTPDGREGAGGIGFGELELEDDEGDEFEFADLPQSTAAPARGSLPESIAARPEEHRSPPEARKSVVEEAPKKKGKGPLVAGVGLVALLGGGAALGLTNYGIFGRYAIEQMLPDAADAGAELRRAEEQAAPDTYDAVRASLRTLGAARAEKGLNFKLLQRSIVHENLFQLRFGENAESQARVAAMWTRLEERGADDDKLARASQRAVEGDLQAAATMASGVSGDPYANLIAGEAYLALESYEEAAESFAAVAAELPRAQWGLARARVALQSEDAAAAVDQTLTMSPRHAEARLAKARILAGAEDGEVAMRLAQEAAGVTPVDGERLRTARSTRAAALSLVGELSEDAGRLGAAGEAYDSALRLDPYRVEALLGSGRVLLNERRWRDAMTKFEEVLAGNHLTGSVLPGADPAEVQARIGIAQALINLERADDARERLGELGPEHARNANVMLWLGRVDEAAREFERAESYYRRMIEVAPERIDGYLALAQLFDSLGRREAVAEILNDARQAVPESAAMRVRLGEAELARDQVARALREFRSAVEMAPRNAAGLFGMGVALRRSGELAEADSVFDRLSALDENYPGLALQQGLIFEAQGRADRAVAAYRQALQQFPEDLDLKLRLGAALVVSGEVDEAEPILADVMRQRSNSAEAEFYTGRVHFARQQRGVAIRHFDRATTLDPTQAQYFLYLAWAFLESGQVGQALEATNAALERDPDFGDAYWIRGRARLAAGVVNDALSDLSRALELSPSRFEAHAAMAECYDQLRRGEDAVRAYQVAIEHDATRGPWWYRLGKIRLDLGRLSEAVTALTRSIELAGEDTTTGYAPMAYRARGDAYRLSGNASAALQDYRVYQRTPTLAEHDRDEVDRWIAELQGSP